MKLIETKIDLTPLPQYIKNEVEITDLTSNGKQYTISFKLKGGETEPQTVIVPECHFILIDKFMKFRKKLTDTDFVELYNATLEFIDTNTKAV